MPRHRRGQALGVHAAWKEAIHRRQVMLQLGDLDRHPSWTGPLSLDVPRAGREDVSPTHGQHPVGNEENALALEARDAVAAFRQRAIDVDEDTHPITDRHVIAHPDDASSENVCTFQDGFSTESATH